MIKNPISIVLAHLHHPSDVQQFLAEFLTENELNNLNNRLALLELLSQGKSYQEINKVTKASTATIASVSSQINKPHIKKALGILKELEIIKKLM